MTLGPKIYVAGHHGMVGSAIVRALQSSKNAVIPGLTGDPRIADQVRNDKEKATIITRTHAELDLCDQAVVRAFFEAEKSDQVYMAAAKVGGIHANNTYPAEVIYQNLMVQANVIHQAWCAGVKRLLFLGSSCIYPKNVPQPMSESALLTGPLEPTNEPYAIAKIAGIKMCESYSVLDMAKALEKASDRPVPFRIAMRRVRGSAKSWADPTLAKQLIGWQASHGRDRMHADAYCWHHRSTR